MDTNGIPDGIPRLGKDSIGKGSLEEESIGKDNNTLYTSTLQVGEIGDCKGEEKSVPPDLSERAEYWKRSIALCEKNKWDSTNLKQMAAAEGIIL